MNATKKISKVIGILAAAAGLSATAFMLSATPAVAQPGDPTSDGCFATAASVAPNPAGTPYSARINKGPSCSTDRVDCTAASCHVSLSGGAATANGQAAMQATVRVLAQSPNGGPISGITLGTAQCDAAGPERASIAPAECEVFLPFSAAQIQAKVGPTLNVLGFEATCHFQRIGANPVTVHNAAIGCELNTLNA